MSNSGWPQTQQPTRLHCPWDSPGKNTGVGCHFLLQCMKVKSKRKVAQSCLTLSDPMDCSLPGSSVQGIFQARVLEWGAIAFSWNTLKLLLSKAPPLRSTPVTREAVCMETICRLYCMFLGTSRYLGDHYPEARRRPISLRCFQDHQSVFHICHRPVFWVRLH